jgi:hypothetical protein
VGTKTEHLPFYAAKLKDLTWATTVTAHCVCGHVAEISVEVLWRGLPLWMPVSEIYRHLRCAAAPRSIVGALWATTAWSSARALPLLCYLAKAPQSTKLGSSRNTIRTAAASDCR